MDNSILFYKLLATNDDNQYITEYIKKEGSYYIIYSHKGKRLGKYKSKKDASKRLRQIEYFKHKNK